MAAVFVVACLLLLKDTVRTDKTAEPQLVLQVKLGEPFTLICSYNCSSGWVRGSWQLVSPVPSGVEPVIEGEPNITQRGDICSLSLTCLVRAPIQSPYRYSCVTQETDHPNLTRKTEQSVLVQMQAHFSEVSTSPTHLDCGAQHESLSSSLKLNISPEARDVQLYYRRAPAGPKEVLLPSKHIRARLGSFLSFHCYVCSTQTSPLHWAKKNGTTWWQIPDSSATLTLPEMKEEHAGSYKCESASAHNTFTIEVERPRVTWWLKGLAGVVALLGVGLVAAAVFFCLTLKMKSEAAQPPINDCPGGLRKETRDLQPARDDAGPRRSEIMPVQIIAEDCQSVQEVPYADIMISVRVSSTPELSNISYLAPEDYGKRWREEAAQGPLLQASRSADRLHVHKREAGRKMSTSSEYAVINYYPEPLC